VEYTTVEEAMSELRCSFCNKAAAEVKKMITGPKGVAICDECVEVCQQVVAGKFDDLSPSDDDRPIGWATGEPPKQR